MKKVVISLLLFVFITFYSFSDLNMSTSEGMNSIERPDIQRINFPKDEQKENISTAPSSTNLYQGFSSNDHLLNSESYDTNETQRLFSSLNETYTPSISISGNYKKENFIEKMGTTMNVLTFPYKGNYSINANITNLCAKHIKNGDAENNGSFYSDTVNVVGEQLSRTFSSSEENWVWALDVQNTDQSKYAIYPEKLPLFHNNIMVSYDFYLNSSSSIKDIANASLLVDLIFDEFRITIVNWHSYNDVSSGINETANYKLVQDDTAWDDNWYSYSLNISQFIINEQLEKPTTLDSVGFFVTSPEYSESKILFDNFQINSNFAPSDVNLHVNDIPVFNTHNGGNFQLYTGFIDNLDDTVYDLNWSHNCTYEIEFDHMYFIHGTIYFEYFIHFNLVDSDYFVYNLTSTTLNMHIQEIFLVFPSYWILDSLKSPILIADYKVMNNTHYSASFNLNGSSTFSCSFNIFNTIVDYTVNNVSIFETLNVSFDLAGMNIPSMYIFWFGFDSGFYSFSLDNNFMSYTFPSTILNGTYLIHFVCIYDNYVGYRTIEIQLNRTPAKLLYEDNLLLPQYGLKNFTFAYLDFFNSKKIPNTTVIAILDGHTLDVNKLVEYYVIPISAYYLTTGNYTIKLFLKSPTHATVLQDLNFFVYNSVINISFFHRALNYKQYEFEFNLSSSNAPVAFASLKLSLSNNLTFYGSSDNYGTYKVMIPFSFYGESLSIELIFLNQHSIFLKKTFHLNFTFSNVDYSRSNDELVITNNFTLVYDLFYPEADSIWFLYVGDEMLPILDAYISTKTDHIPVIVEDEVIYWHTPKDQNLEGHKLVILTNGFSYDAEVKLSGDSPSISFKLTTTKNLHNFSFIYSTNESFNFFEYEWVLMSTDNQDVSKDYSMIITNRYVYLSNISLSEGISLNLYLIGSKTKTNSLPIIVPLVSSSGLLLVIGSLVISKIYVKRKAMIIEL